MKTILIVLVLLNFTEIYGQGGRPIPSIPVEGVKQHLIMSIDDLIEDVSEGTKKSISRFDWANFPTIFQLSPSGPPSGPPSGNMGPNGFLSPSGRDPRNNETIVIDEDSGNLEFARVNITSPNLILDDIIIRRDGEILKYGKDIEVVLNIDQTVVPKNRFNDSIMEDGEIQPDSCLVKGGGISIVKNSYSNKNFLDVNSFGNIAFALDRKATGIMVKLINEFKMSFTDLDDYIESTNKAFNVTDSGPKVKFTKFADIFISNQINTEGGHLIAREYYSNFIHVWRVFQLNIQGKVNMIVEHLTTITSFKTETFTNLSKIGFNGNMMFFGLKGEGIKMYLIGPLKEYDPRYVFDSAYNTLRGIKKLNRTRILQDINGMPVNAEPTTTVEAAASPETISTSPSTLNTATEVVVSSQPTTIENAPSGTTSETNTEASTTTISTGKSSDSQSTTINTNEDTNNIPSNESTFQYTEPVENQYAAGTRKPSYNITDFQNTTSIFYINADHENIEASNVGRIILNRFLTFNFVDFIINMKTIYIIEKHVGMAIIDLETLLVDNSKMFQNTQLQQFDYLEYSSFGNSYFVGVSAFNFPPEKPEFFFEFHTDDEFNPRLNRVWVSSEKRRFDNFITDLKRFTAIFDKTKNELIFIQRGIPNTVSTTSYINQISSTTKMTLTTDNIPIHIVFDEQDMDPTYLIRDSDDYFSFTNVRFEMYQLTCRLASLGMYDFSIGAILPCARYQNQPFDMKPGAYCYNEIFQRFEVIGTNHQAMVAILVVLLLLLITIIVVLFLIKYGMICKKKGDKIGTNNEHQGGQPVEMNSNKVEIGEIEINIQHQQLEDEN